LGCEEQQISGEDRFLEATNYIRIESTNTRVLIADDHDEVRGSIRQLLERTDGFEVVGEAVDGAQAIVEAGRLLPDVVIMDIFMPVMGGLEATPQIVQDLPGVRVVALTADPTVVMDALAAGVTGCLLKGDSAASLIAALRAACGSQVDARAHVR
jgi:DNA-binding NarL/FixJ family response regulator